MASNNSGTLTASAQYQFALFAKPALIIMILRIASDNTIIPLVETILCLRSIIKYLRFKNEKDYPSLALSKSRGLLIKVLEVWIIMQALFKREKYMVIR